MYNYTYTYSFLVFVFKFTLPACRPNFAELAHSTFRVEQACLKELQSWVLNGSNWSGCQLLRLGSQILALSIKDNNLLSEAFILAFTDGYTELLTVIFLKLI
jgi:hypothetical protein